jgi:hypothetical protein
MELFNRQTVQDIKSVIIENNITEAFNQFAENLTLIQESMKEFSRMEAQHGEGEVSASRTLCLAVRGFNVSDCLGFPKFQIPGNACQVECSVLIPSRRSSNLVLL